MRLALTNIEKLLLRFKWVILLITIALGLVSSCKCDCKSNNEMQYNKSNFLIEHKQFLNRKFKHIDSLFYGEAFDKYGRPTYIERFKLNADNYDSFRNRLYRHYSDEQVKKDTIQILEATWEMDAWNYITVWYQEGLAITKAMDTIIRGRSEEML